MKKTTSLIIVFTIILSMLSSFGAFAQLSSSAEELPSAVDLSTTVHLPPIGDQGEVGCCASMAITYMQLTNAVSRYMHELDPNTDWNPSSGDPAYCFAPRFTYNLAGSGTAWVYDILKEQGCPTQTDAPFSGGPTGRTLDNVLAKDWAAENDIWRKAQNYRIKNYDQVWIRDVCGSEFKVTTTSAGQALIERIKSALNDGNVVVTGGYPARWVNEVVTISNTGSIGKEGELAIPYSTGDGAGGHQVAIIAYDDEITCVKNGVTLKGAFKIANSWGESWLSEGCAWVMYDAFNGAGQSEYEKLNVNNRVWTMDQVVFLDWRTDLLIGQPEYIAELTLSGSDRDAFSVTLTATDRKTGAVITYKPYMFEHWTRRPNYSTKLVLSFNGSSLFESAGTIAFNYDKLIDMIPAGKTAEDYVFGVRLTYVKGNATTTVERVALYENGRPVCVFAEPDDRVSSSKTATYSFEPEEGGLLDDGGWTYDNGVLTIFGACASIDRASAEDAPWAQVSDKIVKAVIDNGVTRAGAKVLASCPKLETIICGSDLYSIGAGAFADNKALKEIVFNRKINSIEQGAVDGCPVLETVNLLGQSADAFLALAAASEKNEAFGRANMLVHTDNRSVESEGTWRKGTWTLKNYTLTVSGSGKMDSYSDDNPAPWKKYSEVIRRVVVENGITSIGDSAFSGLKEVTEVVCGNTVVMIGRDAFAYTTVREIIFMNRISSIGQGSVYSCGNLESVVLSNQTPEDFLRRAHTVNYNDAYDSAVIIDYATMVDTKAALVIDRLAAAVPDGTDLNGDDIFNVKDLTVLLNSLAV